MWREERDAREGGGGGHGWSVWLSVWTGPVLSAIVIILYILVLDIDTPNIKPRGTLENGAATIVYFAHIGNIIAAVVLAFALLQEEYTLMVVWICWSIIFTLFTIILIPLSIFTILRHKPARIVVHICSCLLSIWALVTVINIYRRRGQYDWGGGRKPNADHKLKGETNHRISGESNIL